MSDEAKCSPSREATPLELVLDRLGNSRSRLETAVSSVIESHASIQTPSTPCEAPACRPDSFGSSDLVKRLSADADNIDEQIDRLYGFVSRSEVAA